MPKYNDDPYVYEGTSILKNRLNIQNRERLEQFEADSVAGRLLSLKMKGFNIESVFDIKKIHNYLFGHIFVWAGDFRTITMYKSEKVLGGMSVAYTQCEFIEEDLKDLDKKFKRIPWDFCTDEEKIIFIADIVQELWQIHPFREGNTRTTAMFLYFLIKQNKLHLNSEFLGRNSLYFRNALVLASIGFRSKKEYLLGLIMDCVSCEEPDLKKYKTINGVECEKYVALPHTVEKLKTIKSLRDIDK